MSELTAEQKTQVAAWVQAGSGLSEIQKQLTSEFGLSMTYMDVRFLVLDLGLEVQDKAAPVDPLAAGDGEQDGAELPADPEAPLAGGGVSVEVDRITKPGAVVSGSVVFSDGVKATWFLDQMGRLAIQAGQDDYRPSETDVEAFQQELRGALESRGTLTRGLGMADIRLLATDLDGTLIGGANEFPLYADYREVVEELRREHQTIWVACTGRSLGSFRKFFSPMRMMGVSPDFIIVNHAFIYSLTQFGYLPHLIWNMLIRYRLWVSNFRVRDAIDDWHDMITGVSLGVTTVRRRRNRLCLRFDSQDSANVAANLLKEKVEAYPQLQVFQYLMEVDVRSIPFTKGLAVSELARHVGVDREHILAIGDGHNDISMLDGSVADMVGCPLNAEPEVSEVVHKHGGHVARKRSLAGVMEILKAYRDGGVNSELPSDWKAPSQTYNPRRRSGGGRTSHRRKRRAMSMWVFGGMIYAVLAVLAHFNLIPFVSGVIILPVKLLIKAVEKLILWVG